MLRKFDPKSAVPVGKTDGAAIGLLHGVRTPTGCVCPAATPHVWSLRVKTRSDLAFEK